MKLKIGFGGGSSAIIGTIDAEGYLRFESAQTLHTRGDERVKLYYTSRSGLSGAGSYTDNEKYCFLPGTFRQDCQDIPGFTPMPGMPGEKITVGTWNEGTDYRGESPRLAVIREDGRNELMILNADKSIKMNQISEIVERKEITLQLANSEEKVSLLIDRNLSRAYINAPRFLLPFSSENNVLLNGLLLDSYDEEVDRLAAALGLQPCECGGEYGYGVVQWKRIWTFHPGLIAPGDAIPGWNWHETLESWWKPCPEEGFKVVYYGEEFEYEESGFEPIAVLVDLARAGVERKRAAEEERAKTAEDRKSEFENAIETLKINDCVLDLQDSHNAGNCDEGTTRFLREWKLEAPIHINVLIAHPDYERFSRNSDFQRVIVKKAKAKAKK